jgi:hypothetical protein
MDGVINNWNRLDASTIIQSEVKKIIDNYNFEKPELSVPALVQVYKHIKSLPETVWKNKKLNETQELIEACAGLFVEVTTNQESVVQGDTLNANYFINMRKPLNISLNNIQLENFDSTLSLHLTRNANIVFNKNIATSADKKITQPYWLQYPQAEGMFDVRNQTLIGKPENDASFESLIIINIEGENFQLKRAVQYKTVDPVRGEIYQPFSVLPKHEEKYDKENYIVIVNNGEDRKTELKDKKGVSKQTIKYDHIPTITYFKEAKANLISLNLVTKGKRIGYIIGAGDKVPEALESLGYEVKYLTEKDLTEANLKQFDAIITGIRAYNMFDWLSNKNDVLNNYIKNGGNLIVQYLKSNTVGLNKVKVGPYPFVVNAGNRVTEEKATVKFLLPTHSVLNYPNKITDIDFSKWVQERSTYQAEQLDTHFETPLAMNDTGEKESNGSLAIAKYGKGNFAYVSLVLFRQLPTGVPGAYRLLANLIALPQNK